MIMANVNAMTSVKTKLRDLILKVSRDVVANAGQKNNLALAGTFPLCSHAADRALTDSADWSSAAKQFFPQVGNADGVFPYADQNTLGDLRPSSLSLSKWFLTPTPTGSVYRRGGPLEAF